VQCRSHANPPFGGGPAVNDANGGGGLRQVGGFSISPHVLHRSAMAILVNPTLAHLSAV
jgi:hypothetical protein